MLDKSSIVAVYETHIDAEVGVKELQRAGFDMSKLSIVGREYHTGEHIVGYYNSGYGMKYWGKMGAFWGGLWGFLSGAAFFVFPGIGPVLIAGPLAGAVVAGLDRAVEASGLSALWEPASSPWEYLRTASSATKAAYWRTNFCSSGTAARRN